MFSRGRDVRTNFFFCHPKMIMMFCLISRLAACCIVDCGDMPGVIGTCILAIPLDGLSAFRSCDLAAAPCRYQWELQWSSQGATMHMGLQHHRRGRMGPMCPPVTLLLLLVTAPWPDEMTALRRSRHVCW